MSLVLPELMTHCEKPAVVALENNAYEYDHTSEGLPLKQAGFYNTVMAELALNRWFDKYTKDAHNNDVEPPRDADQLIAKAEAFVFNTTGIKTDDTPVRWQDRIQGHVRWQDRIQSKVRGRYTMLDDAIILRTIPNNNTQFREMSLVSVLIHEKAHATGKKTGKLISLRDNCNPKADYLEAKIGMGVIKIEKKAADGYKIYTTEKGGDFFEEGFAEETASRWRDLAYPNRESGDKMWDTTYGIQLPSRYHSSGEVLVDTGTQPEQRHAGPPGMAAYGLKLLNEHTDVDLYGLMLAARNPDTEAESKRALIKAINNIKPGLYTFLRDTPCTPKGFKNALLAIQSHLCNKYDNV